MPKQSAGLLMYRRVGEGLQVLLAHPGGPLWQHKDLGAWSIPKGEVLAGEDTFATALREFKEETGLEPQGPFLSLGGVTQRGGKVVEAWAFAGDCLPHAIRSNTFVMEWPPRSGRRQEFPEIDRAEFFTLEAAMTKINPAQREFLQRLAAAVSVGKRLRCLGDPFTGAGFHTSPGPRT
jgi:predicted NUDIX family NTP pyrophosphohydrolase